MEDFEKRIAALKEKLIGLIETENSRTEAGLQKRNEMADAILRGEKPAGYRYDFLIASATKVIEGLGDMAKEFDALHPDDRCTNFDFVDILHTSIEMIKKASAK